MGYRSLSHLDKNIMDSKLKLTIDWQEVYAAIEENGFIVFPKDLIQKFAEERKEWEIKDRMMEDFLADIKRLEIEAAELKALNKASEANQCVMCGKGMTEGDMVCPECWNKYILRPTDKAVVLLRTIDWVGSGAKDRIEQVIGILIGDEEDVEKD